jgi:hypothetical protein
VNAIGYYLDQLDRALRGSRRFRMRVRAEVAEHLAAAMAAELAAGASVDEAERRAIERFGPPDELAQRFADELPSRRRRPLAIAVAAVLTIPLAGVAVSQIEREQPQFALETPLVSSQPAGGADSAAALETRVTRLGDQSDIVMVNPRTGEVLARAAAGSSVFDEVAAPNGRHAAFVLGIWPDMTSIRIGSMAPLRLTGRVRLAHAPATAGLLRPSQRFGRTWRIRKLAWADNEHLVALVQKMGPPYASQVVRREVVVVDTHGRERARTRVGELRGLVATAAGGGRVAMLFQHSLLRARGLGLVVVGSDGSVRRVNLQMHAAPGRMRRATVVVDPAGTHAFVLAPGGPYAEVDLATMNVRPVGGQGDWAGLLPLLPTDAKSTIFSAVWLAPATIAVAAARGGGEGSEATGVALVDVSRWPWRFREIDPTASRIAAGGGVLLTFGPSSERMAHGRLVARGGGITAYDSDGARLWHRASPRFPAVTVAGTTVFATVGSRRGPRTQILELRTGRVLATVPGPRDSWLRLVASSPTP